MPLRGSIATTASCIALLLAPAGAAAEPGRLADFSARLTTPTPSAPSGLDVHLLLHRADDPDAKPSPIRSVVLRLPNGIRFDSAAVPQCTATDAELSSLGSDACPRESELTVGAFTAITGFGPPADPFVGDDHVFNGPRQFIEVITAKDASASPAFDRLTIDGSTLTAHPPKAPGGPPDGESSVRSIDFRIPVRASAGRSLVTTPPVCPAGGQWASTGTFAFADGTSDTVTSLTPCQARGDGSAALPRLRVSVRPHRVDAGARVRFRLRVTSRAARCIRGAKVRFAEHTLHTDRHGRATLTARLRHPGIRHALAKRSGCHSAVASVRVRRA